MSLKHLNTICYTVCVVCIIAGVILALTLIWGGWENEIAWKGFMTIGVFFLASVLTLSVNQMIDRPGRTRI